MPLNPTIQEIYLFQDEQAEREREKGKLEKQMTQSTLALLTIVEVINRTYF